VGRILGRFSLLLGYFRKKQDFLNESGVFKIKNPESSVIENSGF